MLAPLWAREAEVRWWQHPAPRLWHNTASPLGEEECDA